ncbi:hypothetical protein G6F62_006261 [Rhizopus arrhizus]|uniref:allantoinase n=1 Tax=Rhizopus oryzae TaxID=64495 RepID=A0A9P6X162_RHIOR|nr:hypothetical protein G6F23_008520 [Rhizopus arrhizus]KAG0760014.1 hypothetical protein G6F24_008636 [Rhizopus arrhizus]KAG0909975.1 hypothetical protein G6F33_008303 [Rhizopus arrhizus]KAG0941049.1 hypothetical protein G6F32_008569 [Rhizopus arrhizus]KAG1302738.1 hypothetical protein G6F64_010678 [Rhizopus arrhizus]
MSNSSRYLLVKAQNAILSFKHDKGPAEVLIDRETGKIVEVALGHKTCEVQESQVEIIQLEEDQVLMPGLVDAHVHLNEPGRTEWEGFETGTKAAAAGGITTVVDMPLNAIPPTTTIDNLHIKLTAAKNQCHVDVGFWGGVIPGNANQLPGLIKEGVRGFKCFLIESGVDEFPCVNEEQVRAAMDKLANTSSVLLFHAEMEGCNHDHTNPINRTYASYLHSRPQSLETNAIDMIIRVTKEYADQGRPVNTHIVHLSAASALPAIRAAKASGLPLTVETCYHYLNFTSETIEDGATHYKCSPPIREAANRELLWEALLDGTIDYVVSDHSPCTAQLKNQDTGDFGTAWGGIASVQFGLPVLWTEGRKRGVTLQKIVNWLSHSPAKRIRMDDKKGEISVGHDGDLVIWRPDTYFEVNVNDIHFKNKLSPYIGKSFYGKVSKTILRGRTVHTPATPAPPLPIRDLPSYWPTPIEQAVCKPKIYVYKAPESIQVPEQIQKEKCHESNYNSEIILHNQLTDPTSPIYEHYVTENPEEADFFFIPFFGSCYLYNCWYENKWNWDERCEVDAKYVDPLMDMVIQEYPYWNKTGGRNHIMIHPMDKTFTYYQSNPRFQPAVFLKTVGDKRTKWMSRHRYHRDIVIPSATRMIHHLRANPLDYLNAQGQPKSGKRDIFALFQGCCLKVQPTDEYSNGIRSLFFNHFAHYPGYEIGESVADEEYLQKLSRAKYGLSPMGWTLDTTRIWEFMAFGVVPVVIADGIIEPFEFDVDWDKFIVRVRRDEVHRLDEILKNIDDKTYEYKQKNLWEFGRRVGLEMDAWHFIVRELCRMEGINSPVNLGLGY